MPPTLTNILSRWNHALHPYYLSLLTNVGVWCWNFWSQRRKNNFNVVPQHLYTTLCCKTGGAIIGLRVSKQDGMVFSSSPTFLSLVRVNPPIPTQFWCRNQKIRGKKISSLKSTWKWKSQIMDGVCWIMISNQPTDVLWQNRHISPQQNHALMKIWSKKCRALGLRS